MRKSLAFGVVHLGTSFGVGYALTGSLTIAGAITLVEPAVNTIAHYFFDKGWESPGFQRWLRRKSRRQREAGSRLGHVGA